MREESETVAINPALAINGIEILNQWYYNPAYLAIMRDCANTARATNRNVTRWRDGQMVLRWTAAGMLNAERSFRRIKGHKQMPQLVAALKRRAHPDTEPVGTAA